MQYQIPQALFLPKLLLFEQFLEVVQQLQHLLRDVGEHIQRTKLDAFHLQVSELLSCPTSTVRKRMVISEKEREVGTTGLRKDFQKFALYSARLHARCPICDMLKLHSQ